MQFPAILKKQIFIICFVFSFFSTPLVLGMEEPSTLGASSTEASIDFGAKPFTQAYCNALFPLKLVIFYSAFGEDNLFVAPELTRSPKFLSMVASENTLNDVWEQVIIPWLQEENADGYLSNFSINSALQRWVLGTNEWVYQEPLIYRISLAAHLMAQRISEEDACSCTTWLLHKIDETFSREKSDSTAPLFE